MSMCCPHFASPLPCVSLALGPVIPLLESCSTASLVSILCFQIEKYARLSVCRILRFLPRIFCKLRLIGTLAWSTGYVRPCVLILSIPCTDPCVLDGNRTPFPAFLEFFVARSRFLPFRLVTCKLNSWSAPMMPGDLEGEYDGCL